MYICIMQKQKVITVYGIESKETQFLIDAICKIIELSGYTFQTIFANLENPIEEKDFLIVNTDEYSKEYELDTDIVYSSFPSYNEEEIMDMIVEAYNDLINLIKWMRSNKHAYCMDASEYKTGLNSYNNFNKIIFTLGLKFKDCDFSKLKPADLTEALRPKEEVNE